MLTKKEKERIRKEIGERVKRAVMLSGKSRREVAKAVGVSHVALKKYEDGIMLPKLPVLKKLAKVADVGVEYFFRGKTTLVPEERSLRSEKKIPEKSLKKLMEQIIEFLEKYMEIEDILRLGRRIDLPTERSFVVRTETDLEEAAEKLREMWSLGLDPIEDLPKLLEEKGFKVLVLPLGKVDSLLVKLRDSQDSKRKMIAIAVNKDMPGDRQWFSLAHEIGHYFLDFLENVTSAELEKMINRFSGAFLAPRERVIEELGTKRTHISISELLFLKHMYHLSMQGWIHRAEDLGIIKKTYARELRRLFREKGWDKQEPGPQIPSIEKSKRFMQLVFRAYSEDLITRSRAEEFLGKPLEEAEKELNENIITGRGSEIALLGG